MQINTIESLEWDSQFFGYPIVRITLDQNGVDKIDNLFLQLASAKFRLAYFFVPPHETKLNDILVKKGCKLVDQKTLFSKSTQKHNDISNQIKEMQSEEVNKQLIDLVLQAGLFSRFNVDKNFANREYERLYIEWLRKSLNKTIAFKTLVAYNGNDVIGLITLGKKDHLANIGLMVVDQKYRGKGVGNDLIKNADTIAFEMGFKIINVVTQFQNTSSCKFYERSNFKIETITNIYHYWQ